MTIRRYLAATAREAMRDVRRDLGDEAVILSNKRVGRQVEILAAAPDAVEALVERGAARSAAVRGAARGEAVPPAAESFQEFIRRQSQSRVAAAAAPGAAATKTIQRPSAPARGVQMYSEVAAEMPDEVAADEGAWGATPWGRADDDLPLPRAATSATIPLQPQFEAHLPAPPVTDATPVTAAPAASEAQPAPAVFRRRPARSAPAQVVPMPRPQVPLASAVPTGTVQAAVTATPGVPTAHARAAAVAGGIPATAPATTGAQAPAAPTPVARPMADHRPTAIFPARPAPSPTAGGDAQCTDARSAIRPAQSEPAPADPRLFAELQAMRALLQDQLASLSSSVAAVDAQHRKPLQVKLMTRLLTAGFSPELARRVASNAPADLVGEQAEVWLHDVLAHNLKCAADTDGIVERGGVYALVGPTGVGKTTTVAKLAARHAVRHGTSTLGLITLDSYRIGAHEQLRTYGRILGTPVHLAQDGATLREVIASMHGKRLVLIDTCGVSQRDERLAELMSALAAADTPARPVARVLLLNSASHAETGEDVARAWRAHWTAADGAILTKLDEAARIGGALDVLLRYKLALFGLTNGQRVPEDWHPANARLLAHLSLKPASRVFALGEDEAALLAHGAAVARSTAHA
ncbi:MAG: flagellar biosynthesis protein FlhF [Burkholderiaceae bacterium]